MLQLLLVRLPSQIDELLQNDDRKGLILCMHLWNRLKSTEKLKKTLSNYREDKLTFLNKYKTMAKVYN